MGEESLGRGRQSVAHGVVAAITEARAVDDSERSYFRFIQHSNQGVFGIQGVFRAGVYLSMPFHSHFSVSLRRCPRPAAAVALSLARSDYCAVQRADVLPWRSRLRGAMPSAAAVRTAS